MIWPFGRRADPTSDLPPARWQQALAGVPWLRGLDGDREAALQALVARFLRDKTITPVQGLRLSEVQRLCHRVAIIKDGGIVAVQDMDELRKNACKRVTMTLRDGAFDAESLAGVTDFAQTGAECSFLYRGSADALISALSRVQVENVDISEPTLEEIFLHYYA